MADQHTSYEGADRSLEELLAEASTLAAELSHELGGLETDLALEEFRTPSAATDHESELNAELDKLETTEESSPNAEAAADMSLLDAFDADESTPQSSTDDSDPQTDPAGLDSAESDEENVPDFMKEFTGADSTTPEPVPPVKSSGTGQSPSVERPGVVGTGMLGVVGSVAEPVAENADSEPTADEPVAAEPTQPNQPGRLAAFARSAMAKVSARAAPMGLRVGNLGVRLLETIDRPFGRIGEPIRRIVGWVAIATFGTSTVAYFVSLF